MEIWIGRIVGLRCSGKMIFGLHQAFRSSRARPRAFYLTLAGRRRAPCRALAGDEVRDPGAVGIDHHLSRSHLVGVATGSV